MSIHPDDEFSLRTGLEFELDDVVPGDGLAAAIITRYRRGRRRRVAGAIGLVIVVAGMGVPLGLAASTPPDPGRTVLRVAAYTLTLPGQYRLVAGRSAPCHPRAGDSLPGAPAPVAQGAVAQGAVAQGAVAQGAVAQGAVAQGAVAPGGRCVALLLTPPFTPPEPGGADDPNIPASAQAVTVGRYRAWLIPGGYGQADGLALVIEGAPRAGQVRDLVINSAGLSRTALVSAVSAGLS